MVEKSDLQINGNINGKALIKTSTKTRFTANLDITDFALKKTPLGPSRFKLIMA
jgi:hypothetical protein